MTKLVMHVQTITVILLLIELVVLILMVMVILMLMPNGMFLMVLMHSRQTQLNGLTLMVMDLVIMRPDTLPMIAQQKRVIHGKITHWDVLI